MKFHTVTISGPDDRTALDDLRAVTQDHPFVEWGVLLSHKEEPRPEYPTRDWLGHTLRIGEYRRSFNQELSEEEYSVLETWWQQVQTVRKRDVKIPENSEVVA